MSITSKIWRKVNEFKRKITSRRSSGRIKTTTIDSSYTATGDEFYIGVVSEKPITVYLPAAAPDGKIIIIKAEMKPPLGGRKVNITTKDGSKIDGYTDACITVSNEKMVLVRNNGNWFIIS